MHCVSKEIQSKFSSKNPFTQLMHSAERKFACDICEKNSKELWKLEITKPVYVHAVDRKHCCQDKSNSPSSHGCSVNSVHQSADKRHSCDNCQKFNTSLSKHMPEVNISVQKDSSVISVTLKANEKLRYDITKLFTNQICRFPASFAPQLSPSKVLLSNTWKISIKRTEQILFHYLRGPFCLPRCILCKYIKHISLFHRKTIAATHQKMIQIKIQVKNIHN